MLFVYPYTVRQGDDLMWQVRFPDVPEALTEGETEDEAHALALDALISSLGGILRLCRDLPKPSKEGEFFVVVPMIQAAKLALYQTMREHRLNNTAFAHKLGVQKREVRRMIGLDFPTNIGAIEKALRQFGEQVVGEARAVMPY